MSVDVARLEAGIRHLAAISRPSASAGEHEAADWLAAELRTAGCRDVRVEEERAHGTYWWPLGLLTGLAAVGGFAALRGRRLAGLTAGAFAAAGIAGDIPELEVDDPDGTASVLVLGWGGTYGPIAAACRRVRALDGWFQCHRFTGNDAPGLPEIRLRRWHRSCQPQ